MNGDVTSVVITGCFWLWTTNKISVTISPLREENRRQRALAHAAFLLLSLLQIILIFWPIQLVGVFVSITTSLLVTGVFIKARFDNEGFWSKKRNQLVGGLSLLLVGLILPFAIKKYELVPVIFAILMAHGFHKSQVKEFANNQRDLDALKSKVMRLETDLAIVKHSEAASLQSHESRSVSSARPKSPPLHAHLTHAHPSNQFIKVPKSV